MRPGLVAACLLVAACSRKDAGPPDGSVPPSSSTDPAATAAKFAHPCNLLQRSDAEAILGTTDLQRQEEPGPPGDAHCLWAVNGARGFVELRVQFPTRASTFDIPAPDRTPVPGVGDRAYLQKRRSWEHIDVLKGDQTFFIQIGRRGPSSMRPEEVQTEAVAVARTVASRM
jgi:hypothetical protein